MIRKVLLDQGIPYSTAQILKDAGWDVEHTVDIDMTRSTDLEIINYAKQEGRVCITLDSDFHTILAVNGMHGPSVVRIRKEGLRGEDMAKLLKQIWVQIDSHLETGSVVTVTEDAIRIRKLPV